MSKTISHTYTSAIILTSTTDNPVTVTSAARLHPTVAAYALYGEGGSGKDWSITNAGVINGGTNGNGIQLGSGGVYVGASTITNQTGGTISGVYGIRIYNTVTSSITNQSGATISSPTNRAVYFGATGVLTNHGVISAPTANSQQDGVLMENGGVVVNNAGGIIGGYNGVVLLAAGTVINAGTIDAGTASEYAVDFTTSPENLLVVDPGAVFSGRVAGSGGVLELASAASAGNLMVTNFTGFNAIQFDSGSQWTLTGSSAALGGTITGFTTGDTIDLTGFFATAASYAGHNLTLTNSADAHTTLHFSGGPFNTGTPHITTNAGGTVLTEFSSVCFAEGTHIATERGEMLVEALREGDRIVTLDGEAHPIVWIGQRWLDFTRHPDPCAAQPVRVRRGAIADGVPHRDLVVSPDHAIFLDGMLIPARLLVNGMTIVRENRVRAVRYFHVELARHAVLLAEGLACESYLDTGNRTFFENGQSPLLLHPCFDASDSQRWREMESCAPFADDAARVAPVWQRLADRAVALGFDDPLAATTADPGLHVVAGGRVVQPIGRDDGRYTFIVPRRADSIRLISRAATPCDMRPWADDRRRLGVMVQALIVRRDGELTSIAMDDPRLTEGWWAIERGGGKLWRWTNGEAILEMGREASVLEIHVAATVAYPVEAGRRLSAA